MNNRISELVRKKRSELGLSLREFGALCGMCHTHIDSIEKGYDPRTNKAVNLTSQTITKLANALGMSEAELLGEDVPKAATRKQLKLALFGDADASDKLLDEVIRYANYIKSEGK